MLYNSYKMNHRSTEPYAEYYLNTDEDVDENPDEITAIRNLESYLLADEERHHLESSEPPEEMIRNLPSPYEVTLRFGEALLKCSNQHIRELFCLGAFLLKSGVSAAVHLVRTEQVSDSIGFDSHLFRLSETPGVSNTVAARMERQRVMFLFAKEAAYAEDKSSMGFIYKSIAKHIRSECLIEYCSEVDSVLADMPDDMFSVKDDFLDIVIPHIRRMIRRCNLINLLNKMAKCSTPHEKGILSRELNAM